MIAGAGYRIATPAAATVRMVAAEPALISRLERSRYRFDEGAAAAAAAIRVIMETLPGVPPPNRSQDVTIASAPGTAESDQDYAAFSRELTFSPEEFGADGGRWVARKTVEVPLLDDEADEPEEHFSVTLMRDLTRGSRIQVRNPDRTECAGSCEAEIVIVDDDDLGVTVLDADGNPITDPRLSVPEGEQVTYRLKLDRRPAHWVIIVREPGDGDPDLFPVSERSWVYSPDESAAAPNVHHWEEPFPVTVEALHDDDDAHGERRFRHYLLSDDQGRTELPDLVLVEIDDEAEEAPASVTLWSAELTVANDGERLLGYFGDGGLAPDRWVEDATTYAVEHLTWSTERSEIELLISTAPPAADELTLHVGETALPFADAGGETTFIWTERVLDWEEGQEVAVRLVRTSGGVGLAVVDADAQEADGAVLEFRVSLDRAASAPVSVDYATADGTATAGEDYTAARGTLHFETGETEHTVTVTVLDDAHDEAEETLTLTLSNPQGARIEDGEATGTISNTDPLPQAWLARFGRTAAGQVVDAVEGRLSGPPVGSQAIVAGQFLSPMPAAAFAGSDPAAGEFQAMEPDALLAGSSFALVSGSSETGAEDGGRWTAWGRGAWSRFAGADGGLDLDGAVATGMVGADYEHGAVLGGLALAYSSGSGSFGDASGRSGELQSSVAGIYPYLRLALHERVSVWGMLGYGLFGALTLRYQDAEPIETDLGLMIRAFGVDGTLLSAEHSGGLELAAKADGLLVRTTSRAAPWLAAAEANVSRWRVLLEASHQGMPLLGGYLAPAVETGGRYDDGDAERGAGLVVGGRLSYTLPTWGLTLEAGGEGILAHESEGFREWTVNGSLSVDPGAPGRGVAVRVAPSWGSAPTGVAGLWSAPAAAGAGVVPAAAPGVRVEAELRYGLDGPGGQSVGAPYAGISQSVDGDRTWRLGARYGTASAKLNVEGSRRERADAPGAHTVEISASVRY